MEVVVPKILVNADNDDGAINFEVGRKEAEV